MITTQSDQEKLEAPLRRVERSESESRAKLAELYIKLADATEKYQQRLKNFRGVAHESASGELASSELKVREDFVRSLQAEVKALEAKLGVKSR